MSVVAEPAMEVETPRTAKSGRGASFVEWLLVGGATLFLFPLSWALRERLGLEDAELAVGFLFFHAAFVINDPHFCVTYLLFYEDARRRALSPEIARAQRLRWIVAGVIVPVVLLAWAGGAIAMRSAQALGWMVQLMFLLVGWHYVKQGFGVLTVLSARRGVRFGELERRAILAHCYAAWAYAWSSPSTEAGELVHKGVIFWAPGRPAWLELASSVALAASTLVMIVVLARRWRALPPGPLVAFVVTVWAWTVWANADPLVQYAVPALHSLQYLYFVWLLRRGQAREAERASPFGPSARTRIALLALGAIALGWLMLRGGPAFLDGLRASADDPLGATPFFAAFFVAVNLHHYAMDWVIWRRESPESRYLRQVGP